MKNIILRWLGIPDFLFDMEMANSRAMVNRINEINDLHYRIKALEDHLKNKGEVVMRYTPPVISNCTTSVMPPLAPVKVHNS